MDRRGAGRSRAASSLQRQFWLLQCAKPDSVAYHVAALFHVEGALDLEALRHAADDVVRRHDVLRTCLRQVDGQLLQEVREEPAASCFQAEAAAAAPGSAAIRDEFRRPFDLAQGPLFRLRVWPAEGGGHLIAWTMHHSICDLETKRLITAELGERYALHRRGAAGPVERAAVQYADFSAWEEGYLAGPEAAQAAEYFLRHLGPEASALALPEDLRRPREGSARGDCVWFELPPALDGRLRGASRELSTKPFLLLLSAWALALARFGSHERVVLGVPFTNRRQRVSQGTPGCFVNNLPLAVDLSGGPSFRALVQRVRASMLEHHRRQELPFERIVERLRPARDPSRNPVFQAGFTFEPPPALELEGVLVRSLEAHAGGAQLDVFLTLWESGAGTRGRLEYCSDLFARPAMERLIRCYLRLLESALAPSAQETPVMSLQLLGDSDRAEVVEALNRTARRYDAPARMDEAFLQQAARTPEAVAVSLGERALSYAALRAKALALAGELRAAGVTPGARVGLFMERSLELVTAIWGVLLSGGAYVPLDPELPPARLQQMLEDSAPTCVLSHASVAARFGHPGLPLRLVDLDALGAGAGAPAGAASADDPAYVLFTSGSTGRPKGVANSHRGLSNRIWWMQEAYRLREGEVVLQKTPFSFDVSVWEFLWPLVVGARLEVAPPGAHRDPAALAQLVQSAAVSTIHFVPSMLHAFLAHPESARCTSLVRILCSGEALGAALVRRCTEALPAQLHNLYGPTEAAIDVTAWDCRADVGRDPVPIGRPIANTRLYVLDGDRQPVPRGVVGELYIGGVQVALGYVNRPELTAERFVPDPFSEAPGARLYRTGDLARWHADGNLLFEGRTDFQVKVRGNRIELGEIEGALERHPSVRQAVATVRALGEGEAQIVAHVAARGAQPDPQALVADLRQHLAALLPAAMLPQHVVLLDELPLGPTGKVDRKRLAAPEVRPPPEAESAPRNAVEAWLAAQLCELLATAAVGLHQSLFELGGTSLMAAQLIGRIRERFARDVPLARIFEHPTVAGLAAHLASLGGAPPPAPEADGLDRARDRAALQRAAAARPRRGRP